LGSLYIKKSYRVHINGINGNREQFNDIFNDALTENKESQTIFQFLNPIKNIKGIDPNDYTIIGKQKTKCNSDGLCMIDSRF
jgi:hypothetical protein